MPSVAKEILLLVEHHRRILEHKFPCYKYYSFESSLEQDWRAFLRVEHYKTMAGQSYPILLAMFASSFLKIITIAPAMGSEAIDYADPKFTDDILPNKLVELERIVYKPDPVMVSDIEFLIAHETMGIK